MSGGARRRGAAQRVMDRLEAGLARFGIGLTYADYAPRALPLESFHISEGGQAASVIEARPTHDGFYVARLPLTSRTEAIGLQLGDLCEWVEIAGVTQSRVGALTGAVEDEAAIDCKAVQYDAMHERAPGLFECENETALILIVPDQEPVGSAQMIEIVFRPIKRRGVDAALQVNRSTLPSQPNAQVAA